MLGTGVYPVHLVERGPDGAVRESRERVTAALGNSGFSLPARRITVNLAPADEPKRGSGFVMSVSRNTTTFARRTRWSTASVPTYTRAAGTSLPRVTLPDFNYAAASLRAFDPYREDKDQGSQAGDTRTRGVKHSSLCSDVGVAAGSSGVSRLGRCQAGREGLMSMK